MRWMVCRPTRPWAYLLTNLLVSKLPDILQIRFSHHTGCIIPIHPIYGNYNNYTFHSSAIAKTWMFHIRQKQSKESIVFQRISKKVKKLISDSGSCGCISRCGIPRDSAARGVASGSKLAPCAEGRECILWSAWDVCHDGYGCLHALGLGLRQGAAAWTSDSSLQNNGTWAQVWGSPHFRLYRTPVSTLPQIETPLPRIISLSQPSRLPEIWLVYNMP